MQIKLSALKQMIKETLEENLPVWATLQPFSDKPYKELKSHCVEMLNKFISEVNENGFASNIEDLVDLANKYHINR